MAKICFGLAFLRYYITLVAAFGSNLDTRLVYHLLVGTEPYLAYHNWHTLFGTVAVVRLIENLRHRSYELFSLNDMMGTEPVRSQTLFFDRTLALMQSR